MQAAPIQASPFAAQGAASGNALLTVGDVLPQLPPDLVRLNALSPDQPVAVSAQVLDAALRSGQAALPIFEIYRVCPALFQTPVSPQDPRLVPLPASKLPRLIASAQQAGAPATAQPSPFATAQPAASPFSSTSASGSPLNVLPPRRNGPPPPLADIPRETASPLSLPTAGNHPVFPVSPFATMAPAASSQGETSPASPFSARPPEPAAAPPASLFASASPPPSAQVSFAAPVFENTGGATPASPFAAMTPAAPATAVPAETPFASLFGPKAVPTGQPAPDAPARSASAPPAFANPVSANTPNLRISLASLLRGYSVAELGFDPIMVPTWIMTSQPASLVREWAQSDTPLAELGMLIDGVTDVGFRNVLNHAKRDFQLRIPPQEITVALAGTAASTLPNLASMGLAGHTTSPAAPPPMRVEAQAPAASFTVSPPSNFGEAPSSGSPFAAPAASASVPLFSAPEAPSAPATPTFAFAPPSQSASAFPAAPMANLQAAPPAFANPFAVPLAASVPQAQDVFADEPPQSPDHSAGLSNSFAAPVQAPPFQGRDVPSNPFAASPTQESPSAFPPSMLTAEGFSSAQLLGSPLPEVPPAPALPVTNPFTGKTATHIVDVPDETPPPVPIMAPPAETPAPAAPTRSAMAFMPPVSEALEEPLRSFPPAPPQKSAPRSIPTAPALGIQSHDTNPDQILLRALLGTDDELTPQKIVEMVCGLPGIAACVCLQGDRAISHVGAHKPQAREFQRQATDLAHHLRTLAPLIGIEGAETFTLMSGDRLMTFCFPEGAILGVLHDADPSLGLRDKITLIARELSRMLD
ncbi:hypothetical protein GCM10023213_37610 [Prosthecobacter algae]|uniref:Roadblock/LAMTOR2 domain-containing protein n=2 Tax=Prosthecobacter algae TaxID=1144682 RepID=A0ABP9PFB3_9BACT